MGTNMYPSSSLLGQDKDASIAALPVDELIEKADGFAGVFPGVFSCPTFFVYSNRAVHNSTHSLFVSMHCAYKQVV